MTQRVVRSQKALAQQNLISTNMTHGTNLKFYDEKFFYELRLYPHVKLKQTRDRQHADRHQLAPSTFPALQLQWEYKSCKILSHLVDMTYE